MASVQEKDYLGRMAKEIISNEWRISRCKTSQFENQLILLSGRQRKIKRKGRQMVGSSTLEDLVKTISRRVDLTGVEVEAIAAKLGVPLPALPESRPPLVPSIELPRSLRAPPAPNF